MQEWTAFKLTATEKNNKVNQRVGQPSALLCYHNNMLYHAVPCHAMLSRLGTHSRV
jgi:hypothetical protein